MKGVNLLALVGIALWMGTAHAQDVYDGCNQPWGANLSKDAGFIKQETVEEGKETWTPPKEVGFYLKKEHKNGILDGERVYYETVEGRLCAIRVTISEKNKEVFDEIVEKLQKTCKCPGARGPLFWRTRCEDSTIWAAKGFNTVLWITNDALDNKAREYIEKAKGR